MKKKHIIAIMVIALAVIITGIVAIFLISQSSDGKYLRTAIKNAESLSDFAVKYATKQTVEYGDAYQDISSTGHIVSFNNFEKTFGENNTASYTKDNEENDTQVKVLLYSDSDGVYDVTTGVKEEVDMTPQEFEKIVKSYELYKYSRKNIMQEEVKRGETEGTENNGIVTVRLKSPESEVLEAYAAEISSITGDKVSSNDLDVVAAYVQYSIYENVVKSQSYTFTVSYTTETGDTLKYTVSSDLEYITDFSEEDYERYMAVE